MLITLFLTFFKVGILTFGGGYAMLPMISREVLKYSWLTERELVDFIAVSESTPGSFAVNIATYIGMKTAGIRGAALATLGVVLPSFLVILIIAGFYKKFSRNTYVKGFLGGLNPAVIGMIGAAILAVAAEVFIPNGTFVAGDFLPALGIFAAALLLLFGTKLHPIWVIVLSAGAGICLGCLGVFG